MSPCGRRTRRAICAARSLVLAIVSTRLLCREHCRRRAAPRWALSPSTEPAAWPSTVDVRKTAHRRRLHRHRPGRHGLPAGPDPRAASSRQARRRDRASNARAREVQGYVSRAPQSRTRERPKVAPRHQVDRQCRSAGLGTEVGKRVEPVVGQVQAQLGELPERVVQAIEPVAARVRELTRLGRLSRRRSSLFVDGRFGTAPTVTSAACSSRSPVVSAPPVSSPGWCASCRRASRRDRQHGRRRRVPRPARLPRPRLGHVHARRRVERGAGLGPRRRDVRDARRARALRRPDTWFRLGDKDLATHLFRTQRLRAGAPLSEVTAEITRRVGPRPARSLPMTDDRGAHAHHGRPRRRRTEELAMQEWFVGERAESPVRVGAVRRRRRGPARARACSRRSRTADDHRDLPVEPGDLDRPDPRRARHPRRARRPAATASSASARSSAARR